MTDTVICNLCQPPAPVEENIFDHLRLFHPGWDEATAAPPVTDVTAPFEYQVFRAASYPHGVRCAECGTPFEDGCRYTERLDSFIGEYPVTLLICLSCAEVPGASSDTGTEER